MQQEINKIVNELIKPNYLLFEIDLDCIKIYKRLYDYPKLKAFFCSNENYIYCISDPLKNLQIYYFWYSQDELERLFGYLSMSNIKHNFNYHIEK